MKLAELRNGKRALFSFQFRSKKTAVRCFYTAVCVRVCVSTVYPYKLSFGVFLRVSVCFSVCPLAAAWPLCPGGGSEGGRGDTLIVCVCVRACVHVCAPTGRVGQE